MLKTAKAPCGAFAVFNIFTNRLASSEGVFLCPSPRHGPPSCIKIPGIVARKPNAVSLSDLSRALGTSWPSAARLEDPRHWPSLRQLDRAAAALGKRLVLTLE